MTAFGYIRRSVVHDAARDVSSGVQEDAIRRLAALHGDEDVTILSDMDVSGRKRRDQRPGWDRVLTAVEDGEAHAVYAYSLSRFARSRLQLEEFAALAEAKGVRFHSAKESIDTSTAMGRAMFGMIGVMAAFESDVASERSLDMHAEKKRRDEPSGGRFYGTRDGEDPAAVLAAVREAGSYTGAARLLNERRLPTRNAKRDATGAVTDPGTWHGSTVRNLVGRLDPDLAASAEPRTAVIARAVGGRQRGARLQRLLACGCGTTLTPSWDAAKRHMTYRCHRGAVTPHARRSVAENRVLDLIGAEAERALELVRRIQRGSPADERRAATLRGKRERIVDLAADGLIGKDEARGRLAAVDAELAALSTRRRLKVVTVPVAMDEEPERVNGYLRRLLERVELDPATMLPARYVWRDPALRRPDDEPLPEEAPSA